MKYWRTSPALPAIVGAAMDVPESDLETAASMVAVVLASPAAETVLEPGAMMSGLMRPSWVGPRLEKLATTRLPA